jgi:DNA-binding LacI/PurR family transcriptional regulator
MTVRVPDIAKIVGLSAPSVYQILAKPDHPRYSAATKDRVLKAAEEMGYHPNSAAKALSTKRTGHIGFILSDTIADGWANAAFAQVLAGVENVCHKLGYGLNVSRYNLSNLDSFVFPPQVGQRSVDGLVLTGYVEAAVVLRFREFGIPCVCIGDNMEVGGMIPTIACDIVDGLFQAVQYAVKSGHRRIVYWTEQTRRGREVGQLLIDRVRTHPLTAACQITLKEFPNGLGNYSDGKYMMEYWLSRPREERPSLTIATDQALVAFLLEVVKRGFNCPRDISLISSCDTRLCEFTFPPLCAVHYDLTKFGEIGAKMLIGHLSGGKELTGEMSRTEPCKFLVRQSVGSHP